VTGDRAAGRRDRGRKAAQRAHLPHELLDVCSRRIVNEVEGVSRVAYDVTGKPPVAIEWEQGGRRPSAWAQGDCCSTLSFASIRRHCPLAQLVDKVPLTRFRRAT